jgi:hypothetical protein
MHRHISRLIPHYQLNQSDLAFVADAAESLRDRQVNFFNYLQKGITFNII